jgi:hypothetical protein
MLEEHWKGRRDNSAALWLLLMFELWHRNFLDSARETVSTASNDSVLLKISANRSTTEFPA